MTSKHGVSSHSNLIIEVTRKNLVGKVKSMSPDRYNKRLNYRVTNAGSIDESRLINDDIIYAKVPVGDYICTVVFKNVIKNLIDVLKLQPKPNVNLQSVIRAVNRAIDDSDVLVDCSCPDFYYRFSYQSTRLGYKANQPQTIPAKITNPHDKLGSMCKHLTALLANKKWLVKLASVVNEVIKKHADDIRYKYKLDPDEFIINVSGRPSTKTKRNLRYANVKDKNSTTTNDTTNNDVTDDSEEELIPSNPFAIKGGTLDGTTDSE